MIYSMSSRNPTPSSSAGTLSVHAVDGDRHKISVVDPDTIDIGLNPISSREAMVSGRRVITEHLPTKIRKRGSATRRAIPDFMSCDAMGHIASDRFRDVVETLCGAGVHQFEPVTITNGTKADLERQWYWFIPGVRLFALDEAQTDPPLHELGYYAPEPGVAPKDWTIAFQSDVVGPHPIFVCAQIVTYRLHAHDAVFNAFEGAGLTGIWRGAGVPCT